MFNKVFKIRDEGRSLWRGEESVEGRHTEYHLYLTRHRGVKFNRSSKRHGFPACARACVCVDSKRWSRRCRIHADFLGHVYINKFNNIAISGYFTSGRKKGKKCTLLQVVCFLSSV